MPTTYTTLLGLALPATGENDGTWGTLANTSIINLLDTAIAGTTTLTTDAEVTLTTTTGAANQARSQVIVCSGARTAHRNVIVPSQSKTYVVINATTGGFNVVVKGAATTGITVAAGTYALLVWNGSDFVVAGSNNTDLLTVGGTGTGNVVRAASPTITGTLAAANITASGTLGVTGTSTLGLVHVNTNSAGALRVGTAAGSTYAVDTSGSNGGFRYSDGTIIAIVGTANSRTFFGSQTNHNVDMFVNAGSVGYFASTGWNGAVVGAVTGNASTATALATARAINGVNFDGTAAITVTAAAGTLSGATLAAGVTASSLTSVGTLTSLTVSGASTLAAVSATTGAFSGVITGTGADNTIILSQNATTQWRINNSNAGASAAAALTLQNGTDVANVQLYGTSATGYGAAVAKSLLVYNNSTAGVVVMADNASGSIKFAAGGNTALATLSSSTFAITPNTTVGGTLGVTGATTLASTLVINNGGTNKWFSHDDGSGGYLSSATAGGGAGIAYGASSLVLRVAAGNYLTVTTAGVAITGTLSATGALSTLGAITTATATGIAATYTVVAADYFLIANTAGTTTVTLPAAGSFTGRILKFLTLQAQTTVSASSNVLPLGGTVAGTAILAATQGKWCEMQSDGSNWRILTAN